MERASGQVSPTGARLARAREYLAGNSPQAIAHGLEALHAAIRGGEAEAHCLMAVLLGMGVGVRQDWSQALDHLLAGAVAGSPAARGQLAVLAADALRGGPAVDPDTADPREWLALRESVRVEGWTAPCAKQVLSTSPRVVVIEGFLSAPICAWIIGRAAPHLAPAKVYGANAKAAPGDAGRTNSAFEFSFLDLDMVMLMARTRIAATIGVPVGALEPPQVLHYDVGQRFARHHDWLDPGLLAHAADIAARGQRAVTFLVYINAEFEGGETDFPHLALRRRGGAGDALYFGNLDPSGAPDRRTLHEGLAPTSGQKWLLSQWIRNRVVL